MEENFAKASESSDVSFFKFRADNNREFAQKNLNTESFPTINYIKNGTVVKYESEDRSVEALTKFVEEQQ